MILDKILKSKISEVEDRRRSVSIDELKRRLVDAPAPRNFVAPLHRDERGVPAVIAEVKRASPSKGTIRSDFDPVDIATTYESAGASAISVLTDREFFGGSLDYLVSVRQAVSLPVLRKDFVIDEYQVYEARAAGADAVLLIAAALSKDDLERFRDIAVALGMKCLVEVHNEAEMATAVGIGADLIGINNRNLRTFEVTLDTTARLLPLAAGSRVVSESGIFTASDMRRLGELGADAVLVGEALMREIDIAAKLRELVG